MFNIMNMSPKKILAIEVIKLSELPVQLGSIQTFGCVPEVAWTLVSVAENSPSLSPPTGDEQLAS